MRIGYFDCFSAPAATRSWRWSTPASPPEAFRDELARLGLGGYELKIGKVRKQGFAATKVDVVAIAPAGHRHLKHIVEILDRLTLDDAVRTTARAVFTPGWRPRRPSTRPPSRRCTSTRSGAVDAIVDVVGAVAGLRRLGIEPRRVVRRPGRRRHRPLRSRPDAGPAPATAGRC
ncbi:MAG: nickel insertion protein [Phycisphaerae bacterium]